MPAGLLLPEIRARARAFSKEWQGETSESAEKQSFWNEFFEVFGIHRRRHAKYEVPVSLRDGKHGKIDLFWPATVLVEHKSTGKDLTAAFKQAHDYFHGIEDRELPKFVIVSDFARFKVYDLDSAKEPSEFPLEKLYEHIEDFGFLTGHAIRRYEDAPDVNVKAARLMGQLHESLLRNGYGGHELAVLLVRLMFCFFADKTGIFSTNLFRDIVESKTDEDGHNVGPLLIQIFRTLDKPAEKREKNLDPDIAELEYVNGHLFEDRIDPPAFDTKARSLLLQCAAFDWSAVSPAIFGAMFQSVMEEEPGKRRRIGAHYTSEKNILKVLGPPLLDPLRKEFEKCTSETALDLFLKKIAGIKILDPACGCGNFLVIAYKELRRLELDALLRLQEVTKRTDQKYLSTVFTQGLNVDAMYGIEIEDFPCRVAETALYLVDHLANEEAADKLAKNFRRLPLSKAPHITTDNALRIDWKAVIAAEQLAAIVGNPPFIGKKARDKEQVKDMNLVFGSQWKSFGELDYVAAWYVKAFGHVLGTSVPVAFVSTNSLAQGEQVGIFWPKLVREGLRYHFAHRTFRWDNGAPGEASVYCVIIGWGREEPSEHLLFDYATPRSEPHVRKVDRINSYLIDFDDIFVTARKTPICPAPRISNGSMPNEAKPKKASDMPDLSADEFKLRKEDQFLLTTAQRDQLIENEPKAAIWIRRFYGSTEFINGIERWCLWLKAISPSELRSMPEVMKRVEVVRANRAASKRSTTRKLASVAWLFGEDRQPDEPFILIPRHSSEHRQYVPLAIMTPDIIVGDACSAVRSSDLYDFGILQSTMHMAWMRQVCGRIKSDFRYSNEIVYNNFPWPDDVSEKRKQSVRDAAQKVLNARDALAGQTFADLYDTDVMPVDLRKAHTALDKVVDACYGRRVFDTELSRIKFLFERYAALNAAGQKALEIVGGKPKRRRRKS